MSDHPIQIFRVYRIAFEDGSEYIGHTEFSPHERLRQHQLSRDNDLLRQKFDARMPYRFEILSGHSTREAAVAVEAKYIMDAAKPINVYFPRGGGMGRKVPHSIPRRPSTTRSKFRKRREPPGDGVYRCSICKVMKHGSEFHADRTRWNGRHSQCIECRKAGKKPTPPAFPADKPAPPPPPAHDVSATQIKFTYTDHTDVKERRRANYRRVLKQIHEKYNVSSLHD